MKANANQIFCLFQEIYPYVNFQNSSSKKKKIVLYRNLSSQSKNQSDTPSNKVVMENEKNNTKIFQAGKFRIVINLSVKEVGPACSMLVYLNVYQNFLLKNNRISHPSQKIRVILVPPVVCQFTLIFTESRREKHK